jgi:hypothetical protein
MTIYDSDFTHELAAMEAQEKAQVKAVKDSSAESPIVDQVEEEVIQQEPEVVQEASDQPSDKELNFRALRDSMAEMKAEREAERLRYQQDLEMLKMQMQHQVQKQEPVKHALDRESDDDLLTVGKHRQTVREMQEQHQKELQQLRIDQQETKARLQYSDYDEIMEKYSIPLLQNNRDIAQAFQSSKDQANFAYQQGLKEMLLQQRMQQASEPAQQPQPSNNAQRIIDNARKPGTLSNARQGQPTISQIDRWATCSNADFEKEMLKNLAEV